MSEANLSPIPVQVQMTICARGAEPAAGDDQSVIYLMRHAEADGRERGLIGLARDFAPLTERGREQAAGAARLVAELGPAVLVTSPMTRAMETAAIVGRRVGLDPVVEIDLREWLPDRSMTWSSLEEVEAAYTAMVESADPEPSATVSRWETMPELRRRGLGALRPYMASGRPVVAVCHLVLIHALTGCPRTEHCQVRELAGAQ